MTTTNSASLRLEPSRLSFALAIALLSSALALSSPTAAHAGVRHANWIVPHTTDYRFEPASPNNGEPTTFVLVGNFPFECGQVWNAQVVNPGLVQLMLRQAAPCPGSPSPPDWEQAFPLGLLSEGDHTLTIQMTIDDPDSGTTVSFGVFSFGVVDSAYQPPVDTTRVSGPVITWLELDPAQPDVHTPTALIVHGFYPFDCGQVVDVDVVSSSLIEATLQPGPACGDTARAWQHRFELGLLPAGDHLVGVSLTVRGDSVTTVSRALSFDVLDPSAPPPPPSDSLSAVMSSSRPNPFREETRFSVSLDAPTTADVTVFDLNGRRVRTVFQGTLPRGTSELRWDGRRGDGAAAPGGIYFYRLTMPDRVVSHRVVLLSKP